MTKLLEKALEAVRQLPPGTQDEIAQAMLTLPATRDRRKTSTPRIFQPCWRASPRRSAANLRPMNRSRPRSAASTEYYAVDQAAEEIVILTIQALLEIHQVTRNCGPIPQIHVAVRPPTEAASDNGR